MKERLATLFAALGTLLVVAALILPSTGPREKPVSLPTSLDRGNEGLAALYNWLRHLKVPVHPLRDRYQALSDNLDFPESGNLLITTAPHRILTRHLEGEQLRTWVQQGNHVLVLAAFSDWPDWAKQSGTNFYDVFTTLELNFSQERESPSKDTASPAGTTDDDENDIDVEDLVELQQELSGEAAEPEPIEVELVPQNPAHPLAAGIQTVSTRRREDHGEWWRFARRTGLILLRDKASGAPALWYFRYGNGSILVSRHAGIFSNSQLGKGNNARLVLNLLNLTLRDGGYVIFDDAHQGLTNLYDPEAFWKDGRLYRSLAFLFALWIVYILGHSNRLHVSTPRNPMRRLVNHVRAVGGFFARRLTRAAAARRLLYHFFNHLRRRLGKAQNGEPVWDFIEHNAAVDHRDTELLKQYYERALQNRRVNLIKLNNLIYRLRESMS